jgi:hypothetical protein
MTTQATNRREGGLIHATAVVGSSGEWQAVVEGIQGFK